METPERSESQRPDSDDPPALQIDFSWRKFKSLVSERGRPSEPLYIVDYKMAAPHLVFRPANSESEIIGSGTLQPVSINAKYELRGEKGKIKALKRWKTEYTHLSRAFSDDDSPVAMTWTSDSDFKSWDFICMDENQNPVAKFGANIWALKKIAFIEFMGPKAKSPAAREEILVVGLTLVYCMAVRVGSVFSLFGAFFARPGPIEKGNSTKPNASTQDDSGIGTSTSVPEDEAARQRKRQSTTT